VNEVSRLVPDARLLEGLTTIAARAAAAILALPRSALSPRNKPDHSPVTAADKASEAKILEGLYRLFPGIPAVSEESATSVVTENPAAQFVLVDPLDGTRELLAGRDEFTVNIALITAGAPVAGVVAAPARGLLWRGIVGQSAERLFLTPTGARDPIAIRARTLSDGLIALVSRSHLDPATEAYLARLAPITKIPCGSALKFCLLAEGAADLYPRLAPTAEWDVAAGHAVLAAAGGAVTTPDGGALCYGRAGFRVPGFIAWGNRTA
jgi:3'(2'), 5'-bisphosphate nucleotidase